MTIQLSIPLQPIHAFPSFPRQAHLVDLSDTAEDHGDLHPLKPEYTSLRDLMVASSSGRVHDIEWCDLSQVKFKDKLLKQAARAYLQPVVREAAPKNNVFMQCWKGFIMTNKALLKSILECLHDQAEAFLKFVRTEWFHLVQNLKPHYHKFSHVKSSKVD